MAWLDQFDGCLHYYYPIAVIDEAQRITEEYIYFYNHQRAQRKLNRLTPVEYRNQAVA
ncbi:IS3 family transposase [Salimicrobium salexigens]|uniref:IS3 family transposase n=1 Tax=Salimicrobium salexigens TaxID=908941 RepID=UPI001179F2A1